jgi:hypothetical protein
LPSQRDPLVAARPEDHRRLEPGDFRAERTYLADHVFALITEGEDGPIELVEQEAWEGMMRLPTDVLLRTTDHLGPLANDLHAQWGAWIFATPSEPDQAQFMFEPALDAADEFSAAPFAALHGWYRQATAGLRNALEAMTFGAMFAVRDDRARFQEWRAGDFEPKFGNAVELLAGDARLASVEDSLPPPGLLQRPDGILQRAYDRLCRYSHGRSGHKNADIWQSNGPIFIPSGFTDFWIDYGDTVALGYLLLKIGWTEAELPKEARSLFEYADDRWNGVGTSLLREFFT